MVCTRLERDVGGRTSGSIPGITKRKHLGMRFTRHRVVSLANDAFVSDYHASDDRIGRRRPTPTQCKRDGVRQIGVIDP